MLITIEPFYKLLLISFSENPAYLFYPLPIAPMTEADHDHICRIKPTAPISQGLVLVGSEPKPKPSHEF
jgi:hypothetical protein